MTIRRFLGAAAFLGALTLPNLASAQATAYAVAGTTNMRAGPSGQYPVIAQILAGSVVHVYGCIPDRIWCDAQVQGIRGWVNSRRLEFVYGGRRVLVPQYYAYFGAPIVGFDVGYWDRHYRTKSWYRDRSRWWREKPEERPRDTNRRPRDDDRNRAERKRGSERRSGNELCDGINISCTQNR